MGTAPRRKLVVMNLDEEQDSEDVLKMFKVFGNVIHFNRPPLSKNFAFVTYKDASCAIAAIEALRKKGVNVKYARDESMSHNTLNPVQSLDQNANVMKKTTMIQEELKQHSVSSSDDGKNENGMECSRCNGIADQQCDRCGDYYCSVACQTVDWSRHRHICFPMPRLIRAKSNSAIVGQASRNVSVTNSPQRKRVETHDALDSGAKLTATEKESNELRQPRAVITNPEKEPKASQQPIKEAKKVLTPPRQLQQSVPIVEIKKEEPSKVVNGTSPVASVAKPTTPESVPAKAIVEVVSPPATKPASTVVNEELKNGAKVKLVYAGNHYSAYIRSAAVDVEYYNLLKSVVDSAEKASKLTELPNRNDMVAAPFYGEYYRAVVVKAESKEQPIRVAFLDYGNVDVVSFDDLRVLSDDLKNAKRYIFRVFFDGVDRETVNKEGLKLLKALETDVKTSFTVHCSSNNSTIAKDSIVKLVDTKTKECLNDKLATVPTSAEQTKSPVRESKPPAEPKKESNFTRLDLNCKNVMVLDDWLFQYGKVACADLNHKRIVIENEQTIQDCGAAAENKEPFKPNKGDKCLVRILESEELWWFRAECLRVSDSKAQFLLLESGKTVTALLKDIREFDPKCNFPSRTAICRIKNIPVQDGKVSLADLARLQQKLETFSEYAVDKIEVGDDGVDLIKFAAV